MFQYVLKIFFKYNCKRKELVHIKNMFSNCSSLTSLNLSNFNTINVTNMNHMFYNVNRKKCKLICNDKIILSKFDEK